MSVDDYELVKILDNINSKVCKFRHKPTGKYYIWNTIDCSNLNKQQLTSLEEKFALRKDLQHPNLLEFHELIKEDESCLYHIVVEFCKHGSLQDLMDLVFNQNERFTEEFLCKMLYQIAFVVKTVYLVKDFSIKDIYFDEEYNVKFFNFDISDIIIKSKALKISSLGSLLFEVCTLTKFHKKTFERELKNFNNLYSKEFLSLLINVIKDSRDLKKNIDKVLCNSTLLLKISQWSKYKCFIKINENSNLQTKERVDDIYAIHIEKLKEKEKLLQKKEDMLRDREHMLMVKERKISAMERQLREKLKKAEDIKKACNCINYQKESVKENLDSTYVSCVDSVIVPTSKKLDVNVITKPATFIRTLSEKRIRFKGHSPLKDIDFNRRRSVRIVKKSEQRKGGDWLTCSDDTDKSSIARKSVSGKKCKQLFRTYENNVNLLATRDVSKPINWTEENKKQAFELLRIMNKDSEDKPTDVKHTYL